MISSQLRAAGEDLLSSSCMAGPAGADEHDVAVAAQSSCCANHLGIVVNAELDRVARGGQDLGWPSRDNAMVRSEQPRSGRGTAGGRCFSCSAPQDATPTRAHV
jgi:hypothetical protein